jgi:hypothetical protein
LRGTKRQSRLARVIFLAFARHVAKSTEADDGSHRASRFPPFYRVFSRTFLRVISINSFEISQFDIETRFRNS